MTEERLEQRLEDLNGRLAELTERLPESCMDEKYDRRVCARLTGDVAEAVIPAHLFTVEDVLTAIRRVRARLDALRCVEKYAAENHAEAIPGQLIFPGFADAGMKLAS